MNLLNNAKNTNNAFDEYLKPLGIAQDKTNEKKTQECIESQFCERKTEGKKIRGKQRNVTGKLLLGVKSRGVSVLLSFPQVLRQAYCSCHMETQHGAGGGASLPPLRGAPVSLSTGARASPHLPLQPLQEHSPCWGTPFPRTASRRVPGLAGVGWGWGACLAPSSFPVDGILSRSPTLPLHSAARLAKHRDWGSQPSSARPRHHRSSQIPGTALPGHVFKPDASLVRFLESHTQLGAPWIVGDIS